MSDEVPVLGTGASGDPANPGFRPLPADAPEAAAPAVEAPVEAPVEAKKAGKDA